MPDFSANLGFLWNELPLPQAIHAAAAAGFAAVECHWPYATDPGAVRAALADTGLEMLGINTRLGGEGNFGLSALPGRQREATAAIDEAVAYGAAIGAHAIHVMAGTTGDDQAFDTFAQNLRYACEAGVAFDINILIEPLNPHDNPGYFLHDLGTATALIAEVDRPNLAMMFDCYHVARMDLSVADELAVHLAQIGHIQFASVPDRAEPDTGELDYAQVFAQIDALGWERPLGAEYRPATGTVEDGLGWLTAMSC